MTRCGMTPSAFSAFTAAGCAGFLSTFIIRGIGLPDASIAFIRKRLAAAASRLAVSRKSIVWPVESSARYRYLSWPFTFIRLGKTVTFVAWLQKRSAALVQFRSIGLHPTPNTTGIHLNAAFPYQFADVLVGKRVAEIPAHAQYDQFPRILRPLKGLSA